MSDISAVKALVFDVFGTVVDWRSSLIADFTKWSETSGKSADWTALVDGWRAVYAASMDEVRKHPERGYMILDTLHRQSLEKLVAQLSIKGLTDADLHYLTMGWHRLHPWPDSVAGLTRLKKKYIISPLSNGNVALLTNMAKFAGLPWDLIMSAELFEHYKPDPETYLGAAKLLCLPPEQVMMVAAHNHDLKAAQKLGLKTAFVARPTEYGPLQKYDFEAKGAWDIVATVFRGVADRMGCEIGFGPTCAVLPGSRSRHRDAPGRRRWCATSPRPPGTGCRKSPSGSETRSPRSRGAR
jgi:2-haloacid dehalogenase